MNARARRRDPWRLPRGVLVLLVLLVLVPGTARAEAGADAALLRLALQRIAVHEHSDRLVVWDTALSAECLQSARVPRHEPVHQFTRSMKGVTPDLERALLAPRPAATRPVAARFTLPTVTVPVVDRARLQALEAADTGTVVVGFSPIAHASSHGRAWALLYAEVGLPGATGGVYGGEGFLYARTAGGWKLQSHAFLWQGDTLPFWRAGPARP